MKLTNDRSKKFSKRNPICSFLLSNKLFKTRKHKLCKTRSRQHLTRKASRLLVARNVAEISKPKQVFVFIKLLVRRNDFFLYIIIVFFYYYFFYLSHLLLLLYIFFFNDLSIYFCWGEDL